MRKAKNTKTITENHRPKPSLGFRFTKEEDNWIKRAIQMSKEYMANYGKGERPDMVDLSHYSNSWHE